MMPPWKLPRSSFSSGACVFSSDWSGYHDDGSDLISAVNVEGDGPDLHTVAVTMASYGAIILSLVG